MRFRELDSIRGLAALVVLLHHALLTFPWGGENRDELLNLGYHAPMAWLYGTPLRIAVIGPAAVLVFFVLSGFVLTVGLNARGRPNYWSFAISRVCRIWVPFAFAITISAILALWIGERPVPGTSSWFNAAWKTPTPANVLRHLAMTGTAIDLDSPMWSLIHELRISLIFPFLVLAVGRWPRAALSGGVLLTLASILVVSHLKLPGSLNSWISTTTYVYFFILGILLAQHVENIRRVLQSWGMAVRWLLWVFAFAAIAIAPADTYSVTNIGNGILLIIGGLGAAMLIILSTLEGETNKFLKSSMPLYLGQISYSLYLTHLVTILVFCHLVGGRWPLGATIIIIVPTSIILADLFYRAVEAPSHQFAKWAGARMADRSQSKFSVQA